ncbi:hypothetical protein LXA43DRAFT_1094769 [Ganoderma leucocontextum]|nr:hypothetical protein LXA43DRAFT_1094769 [Ganoderma leucocontextum]
MNTSKPPVPHPEGGSQPPSQGDQPSNVTLMKDLPPRCNAALSALQNILPNHPDIIDAVSRGITAILSQAVPKCTIPLIGILRGRIEADHLTALSLYHADLCIRSTTQFHLDIARLGDTSQDGLTALMHTPLPPDHPFRQYRLSLQFASVHWHGDAAGGPPLDDHPAMPHFLRRVRRFVDRLCAIQPLDERVTLDASAKVLRDLEQALALNAKLTQWCNALRALARRTQRASVAIAGVDACMEEVRALAAVLVADVDTRTRSTGMPQAGVRPCKRRTIPSAVPGPEEVNAVEEVSKIAFPSSLCYRPTLIYATLTLKSAGRGATAAGRKRPRRQLATRDLDTSRAARQNAQRRRTARAPLAKRRSAQ